MRAVAALELFSGAGGLAKGLELAGFEHAQFVEFNKHACLSLRANFGSDKVYEGDVRNFDLNSLEDIDIVAGGPPCQPFSLGGKHRADQDDRDMFPYAIKAIEHLRPKAFIFENVKGLLRKSFSDYFEYILLRLSYPGYKVNSNLNWKDNADKLKKIIPFRYSDTKYDISFKLLNAADYGVPQTRERVFIVGIRSDLNLEWSFPSRTHSESRLLYDMHISGEYWKKHRINPSSHKDISSKKLGKVSSVYRMNELYEPLEMPWQTVRDALVDVPDPRSDHGIADHIFKDGARVYAGHTGSFIDWPSKTIKAGGHGVPGGENMICYEDNSVRYLTVFEAKRIQTFPDDFIVQGAWGEAMRQIGNAVPVSLAKLLASRLCDLINPQHVPSHKPGMLEGVTANF
jgi:DNA (cytosine-5)-methyltransferase 1